MSVEIHKLNNGATVLIDPIPHVQTAALGYFFNRGARHETKSENGIAHFLEHMAFKGTKKRSMQQLLVDIDDIGGMANAYTGEDLTGYFMAGASQSVGAVNEILGDMASNMAYPDEHLEIERGVIIGEIGEYDADPSTVADDLFSKTAFPNHAYGRTILGPEDHIKSFQRKDFGKFINKHYHAKNLTVSVSGNVDPSVILKEIEDATKGLKAGRSLSMKKPEYVGGFAFAERPDKNVQIRFGFEVDAQGHEGNISESVMNVILSGGFSSRLFEEVRSKRGLGYMIGSYCSRTYDQGQFITLAGTPPEKVPELMSTLCDEFNRMKQELVTDAELERAKNKFVVSGLMSQESVLKRMETNAHKYIYSGRVKPSEEFLEQVNAVTKEDVTEAAQRVLSGAPTLTAAGAPEGFPDYEDVVQRLDI